MAYPDIFRQELIKNNYNAAVDLGMIDGVRGDAKFGHCPDADASVVTDVWERGLAQPEYAFPSLAGESLEAVSDNPADVGITVSLVGLDVPGFTQEAEFTLNGTTPVPIDGTWIATNRAFNSSDTKFQGNIWIRKAGTTDTNIYAVISPDDQQTSQAIYMSAVDEVVHIINVSNALNRGGGASANAIDRLAIQLPNGVFRTQIRYGVQKDGTNNISSDLVVGIPLPPLTRIKMSATPSGTTSDVSAEWSMHIYNTEWLGEKPVNAIKAMWGVE